MLGSPKRAGGGVGKFIKLEDHGRNEGMAGDEVGLEVKDGAQASAAVPETKSMVEDTKLRNDEEGVYGNDMANGLDFEEPACTAVWCEKGFISNVISFVIFLIGLLWRMASGDDNVAARFVLTFGLFGFSGGVTNWLAVKMLFDRIPLLYGSGVIPRRFKEIRAAVKKTIMTAFFNPEFLKKYLTEKVDDFDLEYWIRTTMEKESVGKMIDEQLNEAFASDEVKMLLTMAGINPMMVSAIVPLLKPFITNMASKVAPKLKSLAKEKASNENIAWIRTEIDKMMSAKLQLLTPNMVKKLLEEVMRKHLSWLVIWGNVFGALIGLVCAILNIP